MAVSPVLPESMTQLPDEVETEPLPAHMSARQLLTRRQIGVVAIAMVAVLALVALRTILRVGPSTLQAAQILFSTLTLVYVGVIGFKALLMVGASKSRVMQFSDEDEWGIPDWDLPVYTVLVPLYREGAVLPDLIGQLGAIDYPPSRLQILLLIEEDDSETRMALASTPVRSGRTSILEPLDQLADAMLRSRIRGQLQPGFAGTRPLSSPYPVGRNVQPLSDRCTPSAGGMGPL
jgi:hypothetical protein